ncbi:unnamed protein product [Effrenium voratum]|uniref:Uncharacterized protein n=1 Tax=Effrenium voratum TaxID=2562239 RepID=A0AA36HPG5_9DINO|nr:unnamed protein product [Effrenium voratum]
MPDDAQDQPALKRLRGMIEGTSNAELHLVQSAFLMILSKDMFDLRLYSDVAPAA